MPTNLTKQQVADELNRLSQQGATEQELANFVNSSGYVESDFNTDLSGTFRPMQETGSKVAGIDYDVPTAQENLQTQQYYENLTATASTVSAPPQVITENTTVTTTTFQQTTGGGTTTVISLPPTDTTQSLVYKQEAAQALALQQAYQLNPSTTFGRNALNTRLANGTITQAQYDEIVNSTPEQRFAKANEYSAQYQAARERESAAQIETPPVVTTTIDPVNPNIEVSYETSTIPSSATIVPTEPIVTRDPELFITEAEPLGTPPNDDSFNEFEGVDEAVIANENALQEPNVLTDEEVDAYLNAGGEQEPQNSIIEPPVDEFEGVDEAVIANENALPEPPVLSDEEVDTYLGDIPADRIENTEPIPIDEQDPFEQQRLEAEQQLNRDELLREEATGANEPGTNVTGAVNETRSTATSQDAQSFQKKPDWRVRLSLAPGANYLYKGVSKTDAGILAPLQETDGVIFPYTPSVQVNYAANYDPTELTHSNYKIFQYRGSYVDSITITCDFTAQDNTEANYLLAVIHFFRSVTKMFYGQDQNPNPGVPPPLCYLSGLGTYQFDNHPLAITSFNYQLPTDVDYIRATSVTNQPGQSVASQGSTSNSGNASSARMAGSGLTTKVPNFQRQNFLINNQATYVPTRMQITVVAIPIVSRNDISNSFSLKKYASGELLRGSQRQGGGIW